MRRTWRPFAVAAVVAIMAATGTDPAMATPGDWEQFRGDARHTGFNSVETALDPTTVLGLHEAWVAPVAADTYSSPTAVGDTVYIGANDGKLYAISRRQGTVRWSATVGVPVQASPAVDGGIVYVTDGSGMVHTFDATTGAPGWSAHVSAPPMGAERYGRARDASALVHDGVVYVNAPAGIGAFDALTGAPLWSRDVKSGGISTPAFDNGRLFVGAFQRLLALDAATGESLWSAPVGNQTVESSPSVAHGIVYVGGYDGSVHTFSTGTGEELWAIDTTKPILSSPAVAYGLVYVGAVDHSVYALDGRTGATVWTFHTDDGPVVASPTVANGVVYVGAWDHQFHLLDALTGAELQAFTWSQSISSSAAVSDGMVFVGLRSYKLPQP